MKTNGLEALLDPKDCALLLIDHQAFQIANIHSHEPTLMLSNVSALAKVAKVFNVPTVLTIVQEASGGHLVPGIQSVFPDKKPINRTFINCWQDPAVVNAVKATGRKRIVMAGLWTEICLAMPVIQAIGEGFDVTFVTDASGGVSREAHDMAVLRMIRAGANPMTWMAVYAEWQRDWARTETIEGTISILAQHGGATGAVLDWEFQLLGTPPGSVR